MPEDGQPEGGSRVDNEPGKVGDHSPALLETAGEQRRGNRCQSIDDHAGCQQPDQAGRLA